MSSVLITILVHLSSHCHSIQICTLGVHVTTTVWWRHTSDKVLLCVGSLRGESALLFHQLYIFPFFFLIKNLFNIYLNVICIFFYFQTTSNCIFPAWSSMLQRNSDEQCHGNLDHRWTRFPWPRQYLSTVHLNISEAWMITHAGNKSTALLNWYFSKNYLKFVLISYSYSVQLQKESICFLVTINSRDNMTLIELNRRL